jgi:hypothetical protein
MRNQTQRCLVRVHKRCGLKSCKRLGEQRWIGVTIAWILIPPTVIIIRITRHKKWHCMSIHCRSKTWWPEYIWGEKSQWSLKIQYINCLSYWKPKVLIRMSALKLNNHQTLNPHHVLFLFLFFILHFHFLFIKFNWVKIQHKGLGHSLHSIS